MPLRPKNTPPFFRRGSILLLNLFNGTIANIAHSFDKNVALKLSRIAAPIMLAVPSPVFNAIFPVKPSVTMISTRFEGMSFPSTNPTYSYSPFSTLSDIRSFASLSSRRPLCSSVPTFSKPTLGRTNPKPLRAYEAPISAYFNKSGASARMSAPTSNMKLNPRLFEDGHRMAIAGR